MTNTEGTMRRFAMRVITYKERNQGVRYRYNTVWYDQVRRGGHVCHKINPRANGGGTHGFVIGLINHLANSDMVRFPSPWPLSSISPTHSIHAARSSRNSATALSNTLPLLLTWGMWCVRLANLCIAHGAAAGMLCNVIPLGQDTCCRILAASK